MSRVRDALRCLWEVGMYVEGLKEGRRPFLENMRQVSAKNSPIYKRQYLRWQCRALIYHDRVLDGRMGWVDS